VAVHGGGGHLDGLDPRIESVGGEVGVELRAMQQEGRPVIEDAPVAVGLARHALEPRPARARLRREVGEDQLAARRQDARDLRDRAPPREPRAGARQDPDRDHRVERSIGEGAEVGHVAVVHAGGGPLAPQVRGQPLAGGRDHRGRGVERPDVEPRRREPVGVATGRAAEVEDARAAGPLGEEGDHPGVGWTRREPGDRLRALPEGWLGRGRSASPSGGSSRTPTSSAARPYRKDSQLREA
jgi:hypothetical protein